MLTRNQLPEVETIDCQDVPEFLDAQEIEFSDAMWQDDIYVQLERKARKPAKHWLNRKLWRR